MPWDPDKYNEFKSLRYKPFFDLAGLITDKPSITVIDLGCGTGELTDIVAQKLTMPIVKAIDSSAEMLEKAKGFKDIFFEQKTIEQQIATGEQWDLVFANASVQWVDNHEELFPKIIKTINKGGQLAIQMPCQNDNILNKILIDLVQEEPWTEALQGYLRLYPVLSIDEYAQLLFKNGGENITIYQKVYPQVAASHDELYEFIAGSALVPYFERLKGRVKEAFIVAYKERIEKEFPVLPALYAFKRIIMHATF